MTATPEPRIVLVSAPSPPTTTTAGKGPVPPGSCTLAEKLALRPLADAFTVMLELDTVPVTVGGFAGFWPYTYRSASCLISSRRHVHSDLLEMRVPSSFRNGSGSFEFAVSVPGRDTWQLAPSSSTSGPAAALPAPGVPAMTVTAPATVTAATPSTAATRRIRERFGLAGMRRSLRSPARRPQKFRAE